MQCDETDEADNPAMKGSPTSAYLRDTHVWARGKVFTKYFSQSVDGSWEKLACHDCSISVYWHACGMLRLDAWVHPSFIVLRSNLCAAEDFVLRTPTFCVWKELPSMHGIGFTDASVARSFVRRVHALLEHAPTVAAAAAAGAASQDIDGPAAKGEAAATASPTLPVPIQRPAQGMSSPNPAQPGKANADAIVVTSSESPDKATMHHANVNPSKQRGVLSTHCNVEEEYEEYDDDDDDGMDAFNGEASTNRAHVAMNRRPDVGGGVAADDEDDAEDEDEYEVEGGSKTKRRRRRPSLRDGMTDSELERSLRLTQMLRAAEAEEEPSWDEGVATLGNGLIVARSQIPDSGWGVYTTRTFAEGERVTEYVGRVVYDHEARELRETGRATHIRSLRDGGKCIDGYRCPRVGHGLGQMINDGLQSGRSINVRFVRAYNTRTMRARVYAVAQRDIKEGEELFVTYGRGYWRSTRHPNGSKNQGSLLLDLESDDMETFVNGDTVSHKERKRMKKRRRRRKARSRANKRNRDSREESPSEDAFEGDGIGAEPDAASRSGAEMAGGPGSGKRSSRRGKAKTMGQVATVSSGTAAAAERKRKRRVASNEKLQLLSRLFPDASTLVLLHAWDTCEGVLEDAMFLLSMQDLPTACSSAGDPLTEGPKSGDLPTDAASTPTQAKQDVLRDSTSSSSLATGSYDSALSSSSQ